MNPRQFMQLRGPFVGLLFLFLGMSLLSVPGMLHMRFYYTAGEAQSYLASLDEAARARTLWHALLDVGFIWLFTVLLRRMTGTKWVLVYTAVDLVETGGLVVVLLASSSALLPVLGVATALKWMAALSFLALARCRHLRSIRLR